MSLLGDLIAKVDLLATRAGAEVKALRAELVAQFPQTIGSAQKLTATSRAVNDVILSVQIPSPVVGAKYRCKASINTSNGTAAASATLRLLVATTAGGSTGTLVAESVITHATASRRYPADLDGWFTYVSGAAYVNLVVIAVSAGTLSDGGASSPIALYVERIA